MILICDDCGAEVDHTAMACPHCNNEHSDRWLPAIVGGVIGVLLGSWFLD